MVDNVRNIIDEYTENITNIAPRTLDEYLFSDGKKIPSQRTIMLNSTLLFLRAYSNVSMSDLT